MQIKRSRKLGIALLLAGVALFTIPLMQSPMQGSVSRSTPSSYSGGGCVSSGNGTATCFRTMSQNVIQASGSFSSFNPFSGLFQGSISNGNLQKINAQSLTIDSVTTFDGGGPSYAPVQSYNTPQPYYGQPQTYQQPVAASDMHGSPYYKDVGRDEFPKFEENAVKQAKSDPVSTFAIDVDTASYSFVRRTLNEGGLPQGDAVRIEEMLNYFPYNYPLPSREEDPFKPTVAVYDCPWKKGDKLVHIGVKGYDIAERPRSNIVFLIDTSGSMNSPDKLPLLVASFKLMLDSLQLDDMVGIVTYAGNAGVALEPTPAKDKDRIIRVLNSLQAEGSTAGAEGIRTAYDLAEKNLIKDGNNRVILATDGDFNVGISSQDELKKFIEKRRDEGIFLSTMGFGMGNYHDSTMQTLAQNGNGAAAYIDNLNEARKVLVEESSSTLFTIAKDVKIQVEFNPAQVQEYRLIGYETRHLNREDFNNDKIDAGEIGAGHSATAIYEITPVGSGTPVLDDLRYGSKDKPAAAKKEDFEKAQFTNEYAFLKIRYKQPDGDTSKLITRPITAADDRKFEELPDDLRFAAAVAEFGQLLHDSKYSGTLKWDDVADIANGARGKDEYGYRQEFVNLVRLAKSEWQNEKH